MDFTNLDSTKKIRCYRKILKNSMVIDCGKLKQKNIDNKFPLPNITKIPLPNLCVKIASILIDNPF